MAREATDLLGGVGNLPRDRTWEEAAELARKEPPTGLVNAALSWASKVFPAAEPASSSRAGVGSLSWEKASSDALLDWVEQRREERASSQAAR